MAGRGRCGELRERSTVEAEAKGVGTLKRQGWVARKKKRKKKRKTKNEKRNGKWRHTTKAVEDALLAKTMNI